MFDKSSLIRALSASFPPAVFVVIVYACVTDKFFSIFRAFGNYANPSLRTTMRVLYGFWTIFFYLGLHTFLGVSCSVPVGKVCSHAPLGSKWCSVSSCLSMLVLLAQIWIDRASAPFLGIQSEWLYKGGFAARTARSAPLLVVWMSLIEDDALGPFLLLLLTARRILEPLPRTNKIYGLILKSAGFSLCILSLIHQCPKVDRVVAVGSTFSLALI